jgi:hypothetical protein
MNVHLRPETEARLAARASDLGVSVEQFLEMLVEEDLLFDFENTRETTGSFQKESGLWVYRTGQPMPAALPEDTLDRIRRERELKFLGNNPA